MDKSIIDTLIQKGVNIPNPESVTIDKTIDPERVSGENVTIHPGCRLSGENTLILKNCSIGYEAPVTLDNVMLGENCRLHGGYFNNAVFAGDNSFGSGAHVRQGTILEEQANAAHTVGLKQTILFPFVTLGSLINFCDCFMAGGTSRKNHSEVGSSFIHFNYTPNQDKATASMMGDVINGVMLDSNPIFLGGQGGIVGPVKIAFGCITAAGSIIRRDEERPDHLMLGGGFRNMSMARQPMVYKNVTAVFNKNIYYIAQLIALKAWYDFIRPVFTKDRHGELLVKGMQQTLGGGIQERIKRLKQFSDKVENSKAILTQSKDEKSSGLMAAHERVIIHSEKIIQSLEKFKDNIPLSKKAESFIKAVETERQQYKSDYIQTIQSLDTQDRTAGVEWLSSIVESIVNPLYLEQD